ncbi:hypothetical protein AMECASPLE_024459 [Ameca splendens]|uniref:Uncharacterized protein n=1 Tax=Ameca splendens TaxID=208324 RepID=A0ABV0YFG0_9TELE
MGQRVAHSRTSTLKEGPMQPPASVEEDNSAPATQQFCGEEPVPHWADAKYPTQASSCTRTVVGGNLKLMPRVMCSALSRMLSQGSHTHAVAIPNVQGLSGLPLAFQHPLSLRPIPPGSG